jgi:internalin A
MSTREAQARIDRAITAKADILDLRGLGLKVLPLLPTELQELQAIELGCNRLTTLPDELFTLSRLRRLGLGNNRIDTLPTSLTQLRELVSLDLSENRLERLPESIGSLSRLIEVSFYANRLTEVPDAIFALKRLERLDLSTNQLSALPLPADCRYSRLRALDVSYNRLTGISDGMKRLHALRILSLAGNRLVSLQGLEGLVLLEELDVSNNELQSAVPTLCRLPRLRRLDISKNPLPEVERKEISQYDASREKAEATITPLISGGESGSEDASYFDQAPFSFNADLAIGHASLPNLIDLYYKKFSGQDVSLRLSDGKSLELIYASRTRALDFARSTLADTNEIG